MNDTDISLKIDQVKRAAKNRAAEDADVFVQERMRMADNFSSRLTQSPIERLLLNAYLGFLAVNYDLTKTGNEGWYRGYHCIDSKGLNYKDILQREHPRGTDFYRDGEPWTFDLIAAQVHVADYRADAVTARFTNNGRGIAPPTIAVAYAIECDGHDFHERTKEQAQHDKSRDRVFQSMGIPVLRFTGSEIWKDAWRCAGEIDLVIGRATASKLRGE